MSDPGNISNVFLDWSGTVVDDLPPVIDATNRVMEYYHKPAYSREKFCREFRLPFKEFYDQVLPGVAMDELDVLFKLYDSLLWIVMPLGKGFDTSTEQLARWLELSSEIDYAYLSLDEDGLDVAYELDVGGSSYEAFEQGFLAVLAGAVKVVEEFEVAAKTLKHQRKSRIEKNYDSSGLRFVEPAGLGVEFGFRAFVWNAEEKDDGFTFGSKRGEKKWASAFVELLEVEVESEDLQQLILSNYLDSQEAIDDLTVVSRGSREVQSFPAVWAQYSGLVKELEGYWYTTIVICRGNLVTFHAWSLKPEWELMDETTVEFLSNFKCRQ